VGSPGDKHKYLGLSHGRTRYLDAGAGFAPGADAWLANIGGLAAGTSGGAGFRVLAPISRAGDRAGSLNSAIRSLISLISCVNSRTLLSWKDHTL
jgi:hypothetical protein